MNQRTFSQLSSRQQTALLIAVQVRNALEDFHVTQLSDRQMKPLNQITRYAIYEAVDLLETMDGDHQKEFYFGWLIDSIPDYWEIPGRDPKPAAALRQRLTLSKTDFEACKRAIHIWAKRLPINLEGAVSTVERGDTVVLKLNDAPVARFQLRKGRWALQWMRASGKWNDYDPRTFLMLDNLFVMVERDKDGCFWG